MHNGRDSCYLPTGRTGDNNGGGEIKSQHRENESRGVEGKKAK